MVGRVRAVDSHAVGMRSDEALARKLLDSAWSPDRRPGSHLKRLTDEKTHFQYSSSRVTQEQALQLVTALERLVAVLEGLR
jgi:hypothetical protein